MASIDYHKKLSNFQEIQNGMANQSLMRKEREMMMTQQKQVNDEGKRNQISEQVKYKQDEASENRKYELESKKLELEKYKIDNSKPVDNSEKLSKDIMERYGNEE